MNIKNLSLSQKISLLVAIFIVLFILIIAISTSVIVKNILGDFIADDVRIKAGLLKESVEKMKIRALAATEWFEQSERFVRLYQAGDRAGALRLGSKAMKSMGLDYLVITDTRGRVFLRAHEPEKYGDSIINQVNI